MNTGRSRITTYTNGGFTLQIPVEDRVLIACARREMSPADHIELERALSGPVVWESLVERAQMQKLEGLLYVHLNKQPYASMVPTAVIEDLKILHRRNTVRRMYFRQELSRILSTLRQHDIPVIVLKGAALAETVYRDPGIRPMADLDILVPHELAHEAQSIIGGMGYAPGGNPEDHEDTEENHRHLPVLIGVDKPTVVEVHRHVVRLDSPLHFNISGFWDRARDQMIADVQVKVLGPEDLIIHLSLNFFLDRRFRSGAALGQLADIAETIRQYEREIDWELLFDTLRSYKLMGPVGCSVVLAHKLLDAPVSDAVLERFWPGHDTDSNLQRFAAKRILSTDPFVAHELVKPGKRYNLGVLLWAMFRRLVPSRDYMLHRYGSSARGLKGLWMYVVRLGEGLQMLIKGGGRPSALKADLAVDRWLHSIYERP
ncbi:MAG: nucleotidyltransferase family protein [Dehalococcoidia bacterium]